MRSLGPFRFRPASSATPERIYGQLMTTLGPEMLNGFS
jgi:hypothetical protein